MPNPTVEVVTAIEDRFELLDDGLVYVDVPIEGFVRARENTQLFAFRVTMIVPGRLWHWTLLPVDTLSIPVGAAFAGAAAGGQWTSLVEDRRGDPPSVSVASFSEGVPNIPASVRQA